MIVYRSNCFVSLPFHHEKSFIVEYEYTSNTSVGGQSNHLFIYHVQCFHYDCNNLSNDNILIALKPNLSASLNRDTSNPLTIRLSQSTEGFGRIKRHTNPFDARSSFLTQGASLLPRTQCEQHHCSMSNSCTYMETHNVCNIHEG